MKQEEKRYLLDHRCRNDAQRERLQALFDYLDAHGVEYQRLSLPLAECLKGGFMYDEEGNSIDEAGTLQKLGIQGLAFDLDMYIPSKGWAFDLNQPAQKGRKPLLWNFFLFCSGLQKYGKTSDELTLSIRLKLEDMCFNRMHLTYPIQELALYQQCGMYEDWLVWDDDATAETFRREVVSHVELPEPASEEMRRGEAMEEWLTQNPDKTAKDWLLEVRCTNDKQREQLDTLLQGMRQRGVDYAINAKPTPAAPDLREVRGMLGRVKEVRFDVIGYRRYLNAQGECVTCEHSFFFDVDMPADVWPNVPDDDDAKPDDIIKRCSKVLAWKVDKLFPQLGASGMNDTEFFALYLKPLYFMLGHLSNKGAWTDWRKPGLLDLIS